MLVLSTQLIGFSMGGFLRRFLVWPAAMICERNSSFRSSSLPPRFADFSFLPLLASILPQGPLLSSTPLFSIRFTRYLQEESLLLARSLEIGFVAFSACFLRLALPASSLLLTFTQFFYRVTAAMFVWTWV